MSDSPLIVCIGRTDIRQSGVEQLNNDLLSELENSGAEFVWIDWSAYTPSDKRGHFSFNALSGAFQTMSRLARTCWSNRRRGTTVYYPISQQGWGLGRDFVAGLLAVLLGGRRRSSIVHLHGEFRPEMQTRPRVAALSYRVFSLLPRTSWLSNVRGSVFAGHKTTTFVPNRPRLPEAVQAVRSVPKAEEPTIVYLGVISPAKGAHVLLQAFSRLSTPARLVMVGPVYRDLPTYEKRFCAPAEWARMLEILDNHARVEYVGPVFGDGRYEYLRTAWVSVVPSFTEGGCLVLQESLAVGTQVIASAVGPLPEMVSKTPGSAVVPAGDVAALTAALEAALAHLPLEPAGVSSAYALGGVAALDILLEASGSHRLL